VAALRGRVREVARGGVEPPTRSGRAVVPHMLLGGAGSRPPHRGEPRMQSAGTTQRAQRKPSAGPAPEGSWLTSIAKTPALAPIFQ
jgi:hypothetical protein